MAGKFFGAFFAAAFFAAAAVAFAVFAAAVFSAPAAFAQTAQVEAQAVEAQPGAELEAAPVESVEGAGGVVAAAAAEVPEQEGMLGDAHANFCLDEAAGEIYKMLPDGGRETLPLLEQFAEMDAAEVFAGEGNLVEAIDKADAISASFVADSWETVVELVYGHDAFGQSIEKIGGEGENADGERCQLIRAPGFDSMYGAFRDS